MRRRDFLRTFGAATALALVPHDASAAWARVGTRAGLAGGLTDAQIALIAAIADTIIPRTDSPSATDVNVPAFVDVIVSESYKEIDRDAFIAGLEALDTQLRSAAGLSFASLAPDDRGLAIEALEKMPDRRTDPARTYWRLKGLIVHGYFTSEPVMKNVLKVEIMPGSFNGAAPMPNRSAQPDGRGSHG